MPKDAQNQTTSLFIVCENFLEQNSLDLTKISISGMFPCIVNKLHNQLMTQLSIPALINSALSSLEGEYDFENTTDLIP